MSERQLLEEGEKIVLFSGEGSSRVEREFTIVRCISEGASAVGYEAYHKESGKGVLKEFYPVDNYACLKRDADRQLVVSTEFQCDIACFQEEKRTYTEPYETLIKTYQDSDDTDLQKFVPPFEICYGCNGIKDDTGTVYIWTPEPEVEATFDKICDEIHNHPDVAPEHKLTEVLCAINTLTKCICVLHKNFLLHRDINPSNFGFVKFGDETWTQNIALFDINTICFVGKEKDTVGTEGFLEPEWGAEPARNLTDIYSIGAALFTAIVVTDETRKPSDENKRPFIYYEEYYDKLPEMVKESELIKAAKQNLSAKVTGYLTKILQKCLCQRGDRYEKCEYLLEDLDKLLFYIFPADISSRHVSGDKWVLMEAEKSFDANKEKNSFLAMQYHLFEHPLYQCVSKDTEAKENLNILLIGFGNYGQKFLDVCLQAGQIRNKYLNVVIASDDEIVNRMYLDERPELRKFFRIYNSPSDNSDPLNLMELDYYGDITFKHIDCNIKDQVNDIEGILAEDFKLDETRYCYIFIALGLDALNECVATDCKTAAGILRGEDDADEAWINSGEVCINYACEATEAKDAPVLENGIYPVYVNVDVKQSEFYADIERMAFNTHLVWEKDLNIDYVKAREEFQTPYNHDSCVGSVLSAKYKLHSIGIDFNLNKDDLKRAAKDFDEKFLNQKNEAIWNELIWVEHRRWVTEKLCLGWTKMEISQCIKDWKTKNEETKQHVCILRSKPDQILEQQYGNHRKWDTKSKKDLKDMLAKMDELDQMSVELHREYKKEAQKAIKENFLRGNIVAEIKDRIKPKKEADDAFDELLTCMNDIWDENTEEVRLYEGLKKAFIDELSDFSADRRDSINAQVSELDKKFKPILESRRYRVWKHDDVALVENIPFIFTYQTNTCLLVPYATGDNSAQFKNAAAPIVVNPEKIIYVYYLQGTSANKKKPEKKKFPDSLSSLIEFLRKKNVRSEISLIIAEQGNTIDESFINDIENKTNGVLTDVLPLIALSESELLKNVAEVLRNQSNDTSLFMTEENEMPSSKELLQKIESYHSFFRYKFDSEKRQFETIAGCDMLNYIKKQPYISVTEMLTMTSPLGKDQYQPEFFDDYKDLWKQYHDNPKVWKDFSYLLDKYHNHIESKNKDYIVSFQEGPEKSSEKEEYSYSLPYACEKSVKEIVKFLKTKGIVEEGSRIEPYSHTSDACRVVIVDKCSYKDKYDELFSKVYALMDSDAVCIGPSCPKTNNKSMGGDKEWWVWFDNLNVSGIKIDVSSENTDAKGIVDLIDFFAEKGFILNLTCVENINKNTNEVKSYTVSFTYGSRQIKKLLSKAGEMLEIYVYHKLKESGWFDDVVKGHETLEERAGGQWEKTTGEIDCIVTKGFQSCFIECKARELINNPQDISQGEGEIYETLDNRKNAMGINATAVLVADTNEEEDKANAEHNLAQRAFGKEQYGIITIWKKEEIDDIGNTMIRIINGTYI